MRIEITNGQAVEIIKGLDLSVGDSFSNNEPSDLCYDYRMETGYWLGIGKSRLVLRVTTKDEDDESKRITKNTLFINLESLGLYDDDESISLKNYVRISNILNQLSLIIGADIPMPREIESLQRVQE